MAGKLLGKALGVRVMNLINLGKNKEKMGFLRTDITDKRKALLYDGTNCLDIKTKSARVLRTLYH